LETFEEFDDFQGLAPRHLRIDESAWDDADMRKDENLNKLYEGLVIIVSGDPKVGKTHCVMSACLYKGYKGKIFNLPAGEPMYYIDTEHNAKAEYKRHFKGKQVYIKEIHFEDEFTLETDSGASFETVKELSYALSKKPRGILVIDSFSDFCDWVEEDKVEKKKAEGTFSPYDYGDRNRIVKKFLRKMKHLGFIVIYTTQLKPKYEKTGKGVWDFLVNDELEEKQVVATRGTEYWGDVLVRLDKVVKEGEIQRKAIIIGSRFEDKTIGIREVTTSNEFVDIMAKIEDYL